MVVNKYVQILCRVSTTLAVRSLLFENKMVDKSRMQVCDENEFSSVLHEALSYFKHNSMKAEEKECPRHIVCLCLALKTIK